MVYLKFWADYYILIYAHCWELVKSSGGSCGSSSLLFVIVVTVSHFVHDSCKIMTALIIM
jgi:hypothetical protein